MFKIIESPKILTARNTSAIYIHQKVCEVFGPDATCEGKVKKWIREFKNGSENVHNESCSGWPSVVLDNLVSAVEPKIQEDRRFTITKLSRSVYYIVVSENLNFQICALNGFQNSLLKTKKQEIQMCVKLLDPLQWAGWWNIKSNRQRRQNLGIVHYTSQNKNRWNGVIHPLLQRSKPNKNCHTKRFRIYARRTDHKPVPLKH